MQEKQINSKLITWILLTGLVTGTLDILGALLINYKTPAATIFKFIASGVFGSAAFKGGTVMIYFGALFHYCIAFCWTILFLRFYPKFINQLKIKLVLILVTGLTIWVVMNLIVVPLSRTPQQHFQALGVAEDIAVLILVYGLPFTLIAQKFYK
jgi:hypothetical protein